MTGLTEACAGLAAAIPRAAAGMDLADFADAYSRWAAGLCPCCGGVLGDTWDSSDHAIGEGVTMCGYCVSHDHHESDDDFILKMLTAIAIGARAARRQP
jgi:hypothetical protein